MRWVIFFLSRVSLLPSSSVCRSTLDGSIIGLVPKVDAGRRGRRKAFPSLQGVVLALFRWGRELGRPGSVADALW